jgi:hypothetical protein
MFATCNHNIDLAGSRAGLFERFVSRLAMASYLRTVSSTPASPMESFEKPKQVDGTVKLGGSIEKYFGRIYQLIFLTNRRAFWQKQG